MTVFHLKFLCILYGRAAKKTTCNPGSVKYYWIQKTVFVFYLVFLSFHLNGRKQLGSKTLENRLERTDIGLAQNCKDER
jgi:hypothetical protein